MTHGITAGVDKKKLKKLYIIKAGTTFPATKKQFGDFEQWTAETPVASQILGKFGNFVLNRLLSKY